MKNTIIGTIALLVFAQGASAARLPVHEAAESPEYGRKFGGMIGRGLLNISTSFVDLFVDTANETRKGPPLVGTLVGIGKGASCTVFRALSGGLDLLTFWVPGFNGMPVSDAYDNCLGVSSASMAPVASPSMTPPGYPNAEPAWEEPGTSSSPRPAAPKEERPKYTK